MAPESIASAAEASDPELSSEMDEEISAQSKKEEQGRTSRAPHQSLGLRMALHKIARTKKRFKNISKLEQTKTFFFYLLFFFISFSQK